MQSTEPVKISYENMTPEQKNESMKVSLSNLIAQMEPTVETFEDRINIDRLKHLLPLYEKHAFWDTQPVPKNTGATTVEDKEGEFEHI